MSNQQIDLTIERKLDVAFMNFAVDILKDCFVNPHVIMPPVVFHKPIYGLEEPSFTDFSASGTLLTIVFFLAVSLTASSMITERTEGLLDRTQVSGVNLGEILFSHVVVQFFVMLGQTILALVFMILVFDVECVGDIELVVMLTLLQGLCGMCFGFVISSVCTQERNAVQLSLGSFYPVLLLSGIIWPTETMPYWLRQISVFLPLTLATTAMRAIMLRGWGIKWPEVYWGYISSSLWIAIFLIMSMLVLRFKKW
nr:unnamed protein product [Callosobruchus analis]